MKALFNADQPNPKYVIWNPGKGLLFLNILDKNSQIKPKKLNFTQHVSILWKALYFYRIWCKFAVPQHFKELKRGWMKKSITRYKYTKNLNLYVVSSVLHYTVKTKNLSNLFI